VLGRQSRLAEQKIWHYDWIVLCTNTAKSVQHTTTSRSRQEEYPLADLVPHMAVGELRRWLKGAR